MAERGRLPNLVCQADLRGDLHMHTTDSDGSGSLRAMAERARELGHQYIAYHRSLAIRRRRAATIAVREHAQAEVVTISADVAVREEAEGAVARAVAASALRGSW